jgi:hypothetical protein
MLLVVSVTGGAIAFSSAWAQDGEDDAASGSLALFGFVEGEDAEAGYFQGTASDLVASEGDDGVVLDGTIDGLIIGGAETVRITDLAFSSPVEPSVVGAVPADGTGAEDDGTPEGHANPDSLAFSAAQADGCDVLYLETDPIDLNGTEMVTSPLTVDVATIENGDLIAELVCSLGEVLDTSPEATSEVVDLLNQIFGGVGGVAPDDVSVETAEATEEVTEEATADGDVTEEATEEDADVTEEATEEDEDAEDDEDDGDDEEEPTEESTKPVLSPDDDATPDDD